MSESHPPVSETEMEVLRALWIHGPGTVREVNDALRHRRRRWAYTTVQTLLGRLRDKGYVARDERGMAHIFRASVTRDKLLGWRLKELADEICDGSLTPLMTQLVRSRKLKAADASAMRELLNGAQVSTRRSRAKQ